MNLPPKCIVTIYTVAGTLVRRFNRDASSGSQSSNSNVSSYSTNYNTEGVEYPETNLENSIDWNLQNALGIPIASGMYLIHIQVDGVGERTLKWFGVTRPVDLDTF